jgi:3-methyladenine DNA glycosylase AlkD
MKCEEILHKLKLLSDPEAIKGMSRFGIHTKNAYGVSIPNVRKIAKQIGKNHRIAQQLWASGIHEARILASYVDEPESVNAKQMERWVKSFNSWDLCDQCCGNLFDKTKSAYGKASQWSKRDEEFIKRAGFVLMATLAVHDKEAGDPLFQNFFPLIRTESIDHRNFVKKAVNWALRQIGKRNLNLNKKAIQIANEIHQINSRSARWIAADALRELKNPKIQKKLKDRSF